MKSKLFTIASVAVLMAVSFTAGSLTTAGTSAAGTSTAPTPPPVLPGKYESAFVVETDNPAITMALFVECRGPRLEEVQLGNVEWRFNNTSPRPFTFNYTVDFPDLVNLHAKGESVDRLRPALDLPKANIKKIPGSE